MFCKIQLKFYQYFLFYNNCKFTEWDLFLPYLPRLQKILALRERGAAVLDPFFSVSWLRDEADHSNYSIKQ